jgi:hypothetical protein
VAVVVVVVGGVVVVVVGIDVGVASTTGGLVCPETPPIGEQPAASSARNRIVMVAGLRMPEIVPCAEGYPNDECPCP